MYKWQRNNRLVVHWILTDGPTLPTSPGSPAMPGGPCIGKCITLVDEIVYETAKPRREIISQAEKVSQQPLELMVTFKNGTYK